MTAREVAQPRTVPEAVRALQTLLPARQLDTIKRSAAEDLVRFHFNLGSYIRNLWVHRDGSPLTARLREVGARIEHGEELSRLVIEALWHDLNQAPFDITQCPHFKLLVNKGGDASQIAAVLMLDE